MPILTFLLSPVGRWLGIIGAIALAGFLLWRWDASRIERHRAEERQLCDHAWRAELDRAESEARAAIRAKEAEAYAAGVAAAKARAEADAADATETQTIVERVIHASPSARSCVLDAVAASALNRLRQQ